MLLYITYDDYSYIYEPHGTQDDVWSTTLEGSVLLKASGWKPFEMHRVSRHLHLGLLSGGYLYEGGGASHEVSEERGTSYTGNPEKSGLRAARSDSCSDLGPDLIALGGGTNDDN